MKHTARITIAFALAAAVVAPWSRAQTQSSPRPDLVVYPGGQASSHVIDSHPAKFSASALSVASADDSLSAPGVGNGTPPGRAKGKKTPLAPVGKWKWTTFNRSLQPEENIITLSVDKKGNVTGTLVDRLGEHAIKNATLGDGTVSFDVSYHSRGRGDLAHTFTVNLDPDEPRVAVDRPDFSPLGKAHAGRSHVEHKAKHDSSD